MAYPGISNLCKANPTLLTRFRSQLIRNKSFLERFCDEYQVMLFGIGITYENEKPEPAYLFLDGMGYYTIKGIKNSLRN